MASTFTERYELPSFSKEAGPIRVITGNLDADDEAAAYTPALDKRVYLKALSVSEATAGTLTIKSGSTTLVAFELSANQGIISAVEKGSFLCATNEGEALNLVSTAAVGSVLLHVVESDQLL